MTSTTTTAPDSLPTLGDQPSKPTGPSRPRRRRIGRKVALAGIAGLFVLGSAGTALATSGFSDVGPDNPFQDDINWMSSHAIAGGYGDGTYKPTAPVSRQAMASFIHKYANQTQKVTEQLTFTNAVAFSEIASCPAGKRPIAGGGGTSSTGVAITDSYEDGVSWHVRFESMNGGQKTGTGSVFVICQPKG